MSDVNTGEIERVFDGADAEVATLRAEVGRLTAVLGRPPLDGGAPESKAFGDAYLRSGRVDGLELKSMTEVPGSAGGYVIPDSIDKTIGETLRSLSPIRGIADVVQVGTSNYHKLIAVGGVQSGWAAETGSRVDTTTPTYVDIQPPFGQLYANPSASQAMLDDALFDVEAWLAQEIAYEFGRAEGAAFVSGTGINMPKGYMTYPVDPGVDGVRAFGTLQYVPTGVAGGFATDGTAADKLIDLVHSLRAPYRQNGTFVMNTATLAKVRKLKDSDGNYLWTAGLADARPDTLLGYPVVEADAMPDIAPGSLAIAFGDFRAGYIIAERTETSVLRDPYTNKPFVSFYAVKRVGGAVANSEAIKLLKFDVS